ncbi:Peptidoglycan-N-acetylglucosamine deacetylase [Nonomuraea coxensis DSM 45129]|uniref:Peptidoglycan-N-acetylglucosamine deacetylase n=1 Tax=Nonomuraea coxensis DSM 45129 TaxID=1122611 RepID=A0ABX8U9W4_9ACTN|nr:polysaccharide deacetylase family protein [Nonomuraea coxensis]QYC44527.1 Peptidoglycan-N-acetylglucosamine deacetylase [Nonomuraea coxensis DSM 45129]
MRVWALPLALLALAACVTASVAHRRAARPPAIVPMRAAHVDPGQLAKRLASIQPGWPRARAFDCGRVKCVALTFDDGPGDHTGRLLDLLGRRDVRATFFVIGQMVAADRGGRLTRRIVHEGHEIGNHSWSHPALTGLSDEGVRRELRHTGELVRRLTGVRMRVMRPPYGATDKHVARETRREGLAQILWNVDTLDWRDRNSEVVARRAGKARPGSIVLMHDIHATTVRAVPHVLDTLSRRGFTFVTVSELYGRPPVPGKEYTERR